MAFLDETGLTELWSLVKAEDAKGAKVSVGEYSGTGKASKSDNNNATVINYPADCTTPKMVIISNSSPQFAASGEFSFGFWVFLYGVTSAGSVYGAYTSGEYNYGAVFNVTLVWDDANRQLRLYNSSNNPGSTANAGAQCNSSGGKYRYIFIY